MNPTIHLRTSVLPGGRVEVTVPQLTVGQPVDVIVLAQTGYDPVLDADYLAECESEPADEVTLEQVRAALSAIPGTLTGDFATERDER